MRVQKSRWGRAQKLRAFLSVFFYYYFSYFHSCYISGTILVLFFLHIRA
jgi:hypothetical protein